MKKFCKNLLCFLWAASVVNTFAQNPVIDSLEQSLSLHVDSKDTVRIKLLNELAKQYLRVDPEKVLLYSNEAIELSKKII